MSFPIKFSVNLYTRNVNLLILVKLYKLIKYIKKIEKDKIISDKMTNK